MKQQTSSRQRTAVFPHAKAHSAVCIGDSYSCIACLTYTRDYITCNLGEQEPSVKRGFVVSGGLLT